MLFSMLLLSSAVVSLSVASKTNYICTTQDCHDFMKNQQNRVFFSNNRETAKANNEFATTFHRYLIKNNPNGNLFYSPFSILSAFSLLLDGAKGNTRDEIVKTFKWDSLEFDTTALLAILTRQIRRQNKNEELHIANKIWMDKRENPLLTYSKKLRRYFSVQLGLADFLTQPDLERAGINEWVSKQTKGMIPELLSRGTVTSQTKMVLINAMHFQAAWMKSFNAKETLKRKFTLENGKAIHIPMMLQISKYYHSVDQDLQCEILRIPYKQETFAMYVVLPLSGSKLSRIEAQFNQKTINHWQKNMKFRKLTLILPKFKISSSIDAKNILQNMGLNNTFSTRADFSGITAERNVFVNDVVHKAAIEVDEKGTTASAATAVTRGRSFSWLFSVSRPFLFYITELSTDSIIFTGRVDDPSKL